MMTEPQVRESIVGYLRDEGFALVFPPPEDSRLAGAGEYSVQHPEHDRHRWIDAVGVRWSGDHDVEAVAVECKATRWAVYDAIGQGVQYQCFFDEVYVASPAVADPTVRSALAEIGLGNLSVAVGRKVSATSTPATRHRARFSPDLKLHQVYRRLAPLLAFLESASSDNPVRYGFGRKQDSKLRSWCAESVREPIQWNVFVNTDPLGEDIEMGVGINIESIQAIRICRGISPTDFEKEVRSLPDDYKVDVEQIKFPGHRRSVLSDTAASVGFANLMDKLKSGVSGERPHLGIRRKMTGASGLPRSRGEYVSWIRDTKGRLRSLMALLTGL